MKDKAKELVDKFYSQDAKQCALICVEEIYKLNQLKVGRYEGEIDEEMYYSYWEDFKQLIEKL